MKKTIILLMIGAFLGSTIAFGASRLFPDVPAVSWYTDAVNNLAAKGIITGYPDGTFGPGNNVNRAELAVIIDRVLEYVETGEVLHTDKLTYTNANYGFSLNFPSTWEGYIASERILSWGDIGNTPSIDFGFPVQKGIFNIAMFEKNQWQQIEAEIGPKPSFLGENENYVFAWSMTHDVVNDEMGARHAERYEILETFELL